MKARMGKARTAFIQLNKIWSSKYLTLQTKIRLFNTNVKLLLLNGAETWRTTMTTTNKVEIFINTCLRKILQIRWPNTITNNSLWQQTFQLPASCSWRNHEKMPWLDRSHPLQARIKHHQATPDLEPSSEKEKMKAKKHLAQRPRGWLQGDGLHLESDWKTSPGKDGWRVLVDVLHPRRVVDISITQTTTTTVKILFTVVMRTNLAVKGYPCFFDNYRSEWERSVIF